VATLAIAVPLIPGKTPEWRAFVEGVKAHQSDEMAAFHRRVGVTRENWYLQSTSQGDLLIVYLEGDLPQAFQRLAESDHPFDRQLKQVWLETEGIDFNQPLPSPPPEAIYESDLVERAVPL